MLGKGLEVSRWIFPELKCEFGRPGLLSQIPQTQTPSLILIIVIEYQLKPPSLPGPHLWTPQTIPLNPPDLPLYSSPQLKQVPLRSHQKAK